MYFEQLAYFIEVANAKSMSAASNNLHVTQQNISKAIKQLETELGVQLFDRTTNGVFLTKAGKSVYSDVLEISTRISMLKKKYVQEQVLEEKGNLSILSAFGFGNLQVEITNRFAQKYSNYSVEICETDPDFIYKNLLNNKEYDVILTETDDINIFFQQEVMQKYHAFLIKTDALRLQAAKFSPIANQKSISINSLAYLPLIGYHSSNCMPYFFQILNKHGVMPQATYSVNNLITAFTFLENGVAYGLTTKYMNTHVPKAFTENLLLLSLREKIDISYILLLEKQEFEKKSSMKFFYETFCEMYKLLF